MRLRDPHGRLLPDNATDVHRIEGNGYVIFRIVEPTPGAWTVEVRTARQPHTRYTVGGFVQSTITLSLRTLPARLIPGAPLQILAQAVDRRGIIPGIRTSASVIAPTVDTIIRPPW